MYCSLCFHLNRDSERTAVILASSLSHAIYLREQRAFFKHVHDTFAGVLQLSDNLIFLTANMQTDGSVAGYVNNMQQ